MKKLLFILFGIIALIGCKKEPIQHESPRFLAVVDSICNVYPSTKGGFNGEAVKLRFHDYLGSCTADKNPIFKDLPLTVESVDIDYDKDSTKVASLSLSYNYEEKIGSTKRMYKLYLDAESKFGPNESVDIKKGQKFFIEPEARRLFDNGELDYVNSGEARDGGRADMCFFGIVEVGNVKLIPAE